MKTNSLAKFVRDEKGATMVEYILLVGVVALLSIVAFTTFGQDVQAKIKDEGSAVTGIAQ
jgi:Flp pilus assembly pilin Flp